MAKRRWTVLLVPHGGAGTKSVSVPGTVVALAAGVVLVVTASLLAVTFGVVSRSIDLSHDWWLQRTHRAFAGEIARLGRRADILSDSLAAMSRRDDEVRLVAGLHTLSPAVKRAGIGGPVGPWPDRDRLLSEGGTIGREAFALHTDLDALLRRAGIVAASFREASDSLAAHLRELAATPSIMPTVGFISSRFALIRYHPILHRDLPHEAVDIAATYGTRILAAAAGRVVRVGWESSGYGYMVVIDHGYGIETRYAHMSRTAATVGQLVKRGDLIGFVGSTGLSTGPHLHYEVRVHGRPVDPLKYVLPDDFAD